MKKLLCSACLAFLAIIALGVANQNVSAASKAKLNKKSASVYMDKKIQLKVKHAKGKVKWSTSKSSVAVVNKKGKVTAKKMGKAVITAKVGKKKLKCKVNVKAKLPGGTYKKVAKAIIINGHKDKDDDGCYYYIYQYASLDSITIKYYYNIKKTVLEIYSSNDEYITVNINYNGDNCDIVYFCKSPLTVYASGTISRSLINKDDAVTISSIIPNTYSESQGILEELCTSHVQLALTEFDIMMMGYKPLVECSDLGFNYE